MAKNYLFTLAFCALCFGSNPLFALNTPIIPDNLVQRTELCETPPPDSFHMTSAGAHFVSLAWEPIWVGAKHTLVVFEQMDSSTSWAPLDTIHDVSGDSYTVENLKYGTKYRFAISTNCTNGEPSGLQAYTGPPSGLILDLVLNGRTPTDPTTVPPCSVIPFENFDWVGFRVATGLNLGSIANFFEFAVGEDGVPLIKRVSYGPHIVATDLDGNFPQHLPNLPKIELQSWHFLIKRVDGVEPVTIGRLRIAYNPSVNPKTVQICMVNLPPWSPGYSFTVHTAQSSTGMQPVLNFDRDAENILPMGKFLVENPVGETLNIFPEADSSLPFPAKACLINITGQRVLCQTFDNASHRSIPLSSLPSGPYILRIESPHGIQTLKVIKH